MFIVKLIMDYSHLCLHTFLLCSKWRFRIMKFASLFAATAALSLTGAASASILLPVNDLDGLTVGNTQGGGGVVFDQGGGDLALTFDVVGGGAQQVGNVFINNDFATDNPDSAFATGFQVTATYTPDANDDPTALNGLQANLFGFAADGSGMIFSNGQFSFTSISGGIAEQPIQFFFADVDNGQAIFDAAFNNFLQLEVFSNSDPGASGTLVIDDFQLIVPEPASMALIGLGSLALAGSRRRK
ncbi:MAG: PEP-CTERM sorting domain-containing protein [Planctomycetota bacterium]